MSSTTSVRREGVTLHPVNDVIVAFEIFRYVAIALSIIIAIGCFCGGDTMGGIHWTITAGCWIVIPPIVEWIIRSIL